MISIEESEKLISTLFELREKFNESNSISDKINLDKHEAICIEKFSYLISMKTNKYRTFSNYDDLNQDGMEALVMAMKSYKLNRGNFFWWAHKYIDTRISRCANAHTTIKYPLKFAKEFTPKKVTQYSSSAQKQGDLFTDACKLPEENVQDAQTNNLIYDAVKSLPKDNQKVISLAYGLNDNDPMTINKICDTLNIPRTRCVKILNESISSMRKSISL